MTEPVGLVILGSGQHSAALRSATHFNVDTLPLIQHSGHALDLWATRSFDTYVVVDPRVEFLREFQASDFTTIDGIPYMVVSEESERRVEDLERGAPLREAALAEVGIADSRALVSRGLAVLSARVLQSFHDDFLIDRGWTYDDALAMCHDEFAWYNAWLRAADLIPVVMREPLVAVVDTPGRAFGYRLHGVTRADLARGYLGMIWPDMDAGAEPSPADLLAERLSTGELALAWTRRVTRKAPRVQRWLGIGS
jgi:hypothetical protein